MRKSLTIESGLFNLRVIITFLFCASAATLCALGLREGPKALNTIPNGNWSILHSLDMTAQGVAGIACPSAADCWTVGSYVNGNGVARTYVQHWDGNVWSTVSSPNTSNTDSNRFADISCNSASDCWAVG